MISYIKKLLEEMTLAVVPSRFHASFVTPIYLKNYGPRTLYQNIFLWEDEAIKSFFPNPPAKVLVGACGAGRELIALSTLGYSVSGFEPIGVSVNHARSILPDEKLLAIEKGKYEDLVYGVLKEIENHAPYDAVILGWGSISHVLETKMHKLILNKVRHLCPAGPILISWRRASYASCKVKLLRKLFLLFKLRTFSERDYFRFDLGFCHSFTKDEIEHLAKVTNNSIVFYEDEKTYPHAIFIPTQKSSNFAHMAFLQDSITI